jgi:glycosyltransferase involved in cell wall biosynthesis
MTADQTVTDLSVIFPELNEAKSIADPISQVYKHLLVLGVTLEVVVVDGGSTDGTPQRAADAGAIVVRQPEHGHADALVTGFRQSMGRYLIIWMPTIRTTRISWKRFGGAV